MTGLVSHRGCIVVDTIQRSCEGPQDQCAEATGSGTWIRRSPALGRFAVNIPPRSSEPHGIRSDRLGRASGEPRAAESWHRCLPKLQNERNRTSDRTSLSPGLTIDFTSMEAKAPLPVDCTQVRPWCHPQNGWRATGPCDPGPVALGEVAPLTNPVRARKEHDA